MRDDWAVCVSFLFTPLVGVLGSAHARTTHDLGLLRKPRCREMQARSSARQLCRQGAYVAENLHDQARLVNTLLSNCSFDRGTLTPTYIKPFDLFARGSETGDWLLGLDSNQQPSG